MKNLGGRPQLAPGVGKTKVVRVSVSPAEHAICHHGAIEAHRTQSRGHRPRLSARPGPARRHRDQGPDRKMNAAKMPQLGRLPERDSPKKISPARRTRVAECRPSDP